jgi:hypothetical protein
LNLSIENDLLVKLDFKILISQFTSQKARKIVKKIKIKIKIKIL